MTALDDLRAELLLERFAPARRAPKPPPVAAPAPAPAPVDAECLAELVEAETVAWANGDDELAALRRRRAQHAAGRPDDEVGIHVRRTRRDRRSTA